MFEVNDLIMYGITGVCKVIDITDETFNNRDYIKYYVLNPISSKGTTIKIPVNNDKIVMRKILSEGEVNTLISEIPNMEDMWIENERERGVQFKLILRSGECRKIVNLVRSIYIQRELIKENGGKPHKVDEEIMKEAERLINEEFGIILDIEPSEVNKYIEARIS